jgi:hypothetical protein
LPFSKRGGNRFKDAHLLLRWEKACRYALLTFRSFGHSPGRDWGPLDLFGCDRDRPFSRIDNAGLLWLLTGNRLVALSENAAIIETPSGGRQTFRRRAMVADRVAVA